MSKLLSYSELVKLPTYAERLEYLQLNDGAMFRETFGDARFANQAFYHSSDWYKLRRAVIVRDNGCDLGVDGLSIETGLVVHHLNPVTLDDVLHGSAALWDMENLICCTAATHHAIHYGHQTRPKARLIDRQPFDTCPWR